MGLGQYNSIGEYCGPHNASSVFLILVILPGVIPPGVILPGVISPRVISPGEVHKGWFYKAVLEQGVCVSLTLE